MDRKIVPVNGKFYTETEKLMIIEDYLSSSESKQNIWEKHTGQKKEHGQIIRWMRQLGYEAKSAASCGIFVDKYITMPPKNISGTSDIEHLQLKKKVALLEQQLKDAEMKAIAFSTMVDIAEKEFKITIRKKSNTKP